MSSRALAPYLGPTAHLSLSPLSPALLSLVLSFVATAVLLSTLPSLTAEAKQALVAECRVVESAAAVVVNLGHWSAEGINAGNALATQAVVAGAGVVLDGLVEGIEGLLLYAHPRSGLLLCQRHHTDGSSRRFVVDTYHSLFLCLLNLAVHGSLDLAIATTVEAEKFLNSTLQAAQDALRTSIVGVNNDLGSTFKVINAIPGCASLPRSCTTRADVVHRRVKIPVPVYTLPLAFPAVPPSTLLGSLQSLNASLPTLASLRGSLDSILTTPLDLLRTQIAGTISNSTITVAELPVPPLQALDLCSRLDLSFVDTVARDLRRFLNLSLGLLALAAVALGLASTIWERYRYTCYVRSIERSRAVWLTSTDPKDLLSTDSLHSFISTSHHPLLSHILSVVAARLHWSRRTITRVTWFSSYIFHPSALPFLFIGGIGLAVVQSQLALISGPVGRDVVGIVDSGLGQVEALMGTTLRDKMGTVANEWADGNNVIIGDLQRRMNRDLVSSVSRHRGLFSQLEASSSSGSRFQPRQ